MKRSFKLYLASIRCRNPYTNTAPGLYLSIRPNHGVSRQTIPSSGSADTASEFRTSSEVQIYGVLRTPFFMIDEPVQLSTGCRVLGVNSLPKNISPA